MNISFVYQGVKYEVTQTATILGRIVLPDGRVLEVISWNGIFKEVPHLFIFFLHPERIAKRMNGKLSSKVKVE